MSDHPNRLVLIRNTGTTAFAYHANLPTPPNGSAQLELKGPIEIPKSQQNRTNLNSTPCADPVYDTRQDEIIWATYSMPQPDGHSMVGVIDVWRLGKYLMVDSVEHTGWEIATKTKPFHEYVGCKPKWYDCRPSVVVAGNTITSIVGGDNTFDNSSNYMNIKMMQQKDSGPWNVVQYNGGGSATLTLNENGPRMKMIGGPTVGVGFNYIYHVRSSAAQGPWIYIDMMKVSNFAALGDDKNNTLRWSPTYIDIGTDAPPAAPGMAFIPSANNKYTLVIFNIDPNSRGKVLRYSLITLRADGSIDMNANKRHPDSKPGETNKLLAVNGTLTAQFGDDSSQVINAFWYPCDEKHSYVMILYSVANNKGVSGRLLWIHADGSIAGSDYMERHQEVLRFDDLPDQLPATWSAVLVAEGYCGDNS